MGDPTGRRVPERAKAVDAPSLPYGNAFVVQFSSETDQNLEHATGRLEHLQSGRRVPFASTAELLACIVVMLTDADAARPPSMTEGRGQLSSAAPEGPT